MPDMTKDEIKTNTNMNDVLMRYGIHQNRAGLIHCPFHKGDREPSMKIYKNDFHCFGCGANGDVFTFVQLMDGVTFKEAYEILGGTYEHTKEGHYKAQLKAYRAKKKRESEANVQRRKTEKIRENNELITLYRTFLDVLMPMSDLWCEVYNKLQYQIYVHDILNDSR